MPDIFRQFILFCGVGSINTAAGLAVILILSEGLGVHYMLANMLGYACGLMIGFFLHRSITFRAQADPLQKRAEFLKFILIFALAYTLQLGALVFMVDALGVYEWMAQILAIGIYTILNYAGNRLITFRKAPTQEPENREEKL
ncbi:MAG: GtrA family protein [Alphaproteobacteria bacterium]